MYVFLIGNGYDLYHGFPTSYKNFLNVISFLVDSFEDTMKTVGDVLGNEKLCATDHGIARSYHLHKEHYDMTELSHEQIAELILAARHNCWFRYLSEMNGGESGWIDFEKEIAQAIRAFDDLPEVLLNALAYDSRAFSPEVLQVLEAFGIFVVQRSLVSVDERYFSSRIPKRKAKSLDLKRVEETMHASLLELAKMLETYLECFVEQPLNKILADGIYPVSSVLDGATNVVTFNYTHTYEKLHLRRNFADNVMHIHGSVGQKIVLGVDPNEYDEAGSLDTTFLRFKKYYQRVFYRTDTAYISWKRRLLPQNRAVNEVIVRVLGHSLDVTDKDIITAVFDMATRVEVFYHDEDAVSNYITNLVNIYGKTGFDELRESKNVMFTEYPELRWEKK
ncbi:MAG: hypothetical protein IKT57_06475 [Clostridia bacterium]|nr:hypothetical protein [Clostridia bacterium]